MPTTEAQRRAKTKWRRANPDKASAAVRRWQKANRERVKATAGAWAAANPDKVKARMARHDAKPHRKMQRGNAAARQRRYAERHPEDRKRQRREHQARRRTDSVQRVVDALRRRIRMTCSGVSRGALAGLGYSADQLRSHIEGLFTVGMSWANYGEWHVDHRQPVASFVLPDQMTECFALSNLQPLWAPDNLKKGARCAVANA